MAEVRILSGAGRYADPYHDFPATSRRLAEVMASMGHRATIIEDVEAGMADLDGIDLLVVNVGKPSPDDADPDGLEAARRGLLRHVDAGGSLLSVHVSATSFPTMDEWEQVVGGRWVAGHTMHPEIGTAQVRVRTGLHPIVAEQHDFEVHDERYSFLRTRPDLVPLMEHLHDGIMHPLLWARTLRSARICYDALGHGVESYDSVDRLQILRREVAWLTGDPLS